MSQASNLGTFARRYKWALLIAGCVLVAALILSGIDNERQSNEADAGGDQRAIFDAQMRAHDEGVEAVEWLIGIAVVIGVAYFVIKSGVAGGLRQQPAAFPQPPSFATDGPGRFRVSGVDRATKMDTVWHCTADSEANARIKADLEGIAVSRVERET